MRYTIKETSEKAAVSEHTLRYYTDCGLLPCGRDGANRRVFDDSSLSWLQVIKCLKGCGIPLEAIRHYCELCRQEESEENLRARYQIILEYKDQAYQNLKEAQERVAYMEAKVKHYEKILGGELRNSIESGHF